jgi:hypothetical protein
MSQKEQISDWLLRYGALFKKRYTRKQKDRFLDSLIADLQPVRKDIEVTSFNRYENDKQMYRNLYIGDLSKAKKVICTYYDTPIACLGSYSFFERDSQKRKATLSIIMSSAIWFILGFLFTIFIGIPIFQNSDFLSFQSILTVIVYFLYFYLLNKVRKGFAEKNTWIRNTSSILMLLDKITYSNAKDTAYAFLDAGCTNQAGLSKLLEATDAKVIMLDSIGSSYPLYQVSGSKSNIHSFEPIKPIHKGKLETENVLYIISGKMTDNQFILPNDELKKAQLNDGNMNNVMNFLNEI